ncbi:hypothetical protein Tco_0016791 [Tanacetum coccineum]
MTSRNISEGMLLVLQAGTLSAGNAISKLSARNDYGLTAERHLSRLAAGQSKQLQYTKYQAAVQQQQETYRSHSIIKGNSLELDEQQNQMRQHILKQQLPGLAATAT